MESSINSAIKNLTKERSTVFVHFSQDSDKNKQKGVMQDEYNSNCNVNAKAM